MSKFLISESLSPGLIRRGHCFKVGFVVEFSEEELHPKLVPLDAEGYALLVKRFGAEKIKKLHGDKPAVIEEKPMPVDEQLTLRQLHNHDRALPSLGPTHKNKGNK